DGAFQDLRAFGKLTANVDVGRPGVESETGNKNAFNELMRILVNNVAILKRARLGFVGVADEINRFLLVSLDETPLYAAGKAGAAAAAQAGRFHFIDNFNPRHLNGLFQLLITAIAHIAVDIGSPIRASD